MSCGLQERDRHQGEGGCRINDPAMFAAKQSCWKAISHDASVLAIVSTPNCKANNLLTANLITFNFKSLRGGVAQVVRAVVS